MYLQVIVFVCAVTLNFRHCWLQFHLDAGFMLYLPSYFHGFCPKPGEIHYSTRSLYSTYIFITINIKRTSKFEQGNAHFPYRYFRCLSLQQAIRDIIIVYLPLRNYEFLPTALDPSNSLQSIMKNLNSSSSEAISNHQIIQWKLSESKVLEW